MGKAVNIQQCSLVRGHVRVPCSTSNLGAGFDCVGLALDRYMDAWYEPAEHELEIVREGTLGELAVPSSDDALGQAFVGRLSRDGAPACGTLRVRSAIPVGRGLGSSAAARIGGFALAETALSAPFSQGDAFVEATAAEGHPDNAAPCALGGLVAVVPADRRDERSMRAIRLPLSPSIGWAYAAPGSGVSTRQARSVLPATVGRQQAVDAIRRLPALLRGLETGDPALLALGFDDAFHVPYRLPLIPGGRDALHAGARAGAWAVTISGSGSGLIAACPKGEEAFVANAMAEAFRAHEPNGTDDVVAFALSPDTEGAQILPT